MAQIAKGVGVIALSFIPYVGPFLALAASARLSFENQRAAQRKALAQYNANLRDQMVTVKGGVNPRPIVYGRTALGGQLIYAESFGSKKETLVLVIALAHGECDAIETVYFNDTALTLDGNGLVTNAPYAFQQVVSVMHPATVPGSPYQVTLPSTPDGGLLVQDVTLGFGGGDNGSAPILQAGTDYTVSGATVTFGAAFTGKSVQISYNTLSATESFAAVYRYTGGAGQDLSTVMAALGAPSWTSADKCQGMAALIVRLTYAENVWPTGIPNIKAVIRGRKVYDPRSATTGWTANAALCARDYLTFQYGVGATSGRIDDTGATNPSANICDEQVQLTATPTYQDRYTFNGALSTGDDRLTNLGQFEQTLAGRINYSQGKWRVRAGAWTAPALTLDESVLADGEIQIMPYGSRRELINAAKATYINAAAGYVEDQTVEWTNAGYVADDGGVTLGTSLTFPAVTDSARAQRLAKIAVTRSREQLALRCRCNFKTYTWQVGDMVSVTLARYGFSAKPFRIIDRGFSVEGGMNFTLREEPNGIYDWNLGEASILTGAGNTTLPSPTVVGVPTITGITSAQWLYKAGDGTFVARIRVAVTPPADEYVQKGGKLQLQYKRGDWSQDWTVLEADGNATQIWIDPAFDAQNYLIRVRAINSAGYASAWSGMQVHTCQGRPGQIVNLLRNSDWTEDLGYPAGITFYSDSRALRHWLHGGNPGGYARNYDSGKTWNIGLGGCCIYIPSNTTGHYCYVYQDVPVVAGVAYELSASVATHRGNSILQIQYLDAAKSVVLGNPSDAYNSGSAIDGDPYDTSTHRRLWCTGTAPANTVWARVICLIQCVSAAASNPYPFSAWSKAMLCVAPDGVTRETATPWLPDGQPQTLGQRVEDYSATFTGPWSVAGLSGGWSEIVGGGGWGISFTRITWPGRLDIQVTLDVEVTAAAGGGGDSLEFRLAKAITVTGNPYAQMESGPSVVAVRGDDLNRRRTVTLDMTATVFGNNFNVFVFSYANSSALSFNVGRAAVTIRYTRD